jgi:hypothetical protein
MDGPEGSARRRRVTSCADDELILTDLTRPVLASFTVRPLCNFEEIIVVDGLSAHRQISEWGECCSGPR